VNGSEVTDPGRSNDNDMIMNIHPDYTYIHTIKHFLAFAR